MLQVDAEPCFVYNLSRAHKRNVTLTTSQITQTNIPPRELVSYSKETQTQPLEREGMCLHLVDYVPAKSDEIWLDA